MANTIGDNEALAYAIQRGSLDLEQIANAVYWTGRAGKVQPRRLPNDKLIAELQEVISKLQHIQSVLQAETGNPGMDVVAMLHHEQTDAQ